VIRLCVSSRSHYNDGRPVPVPMVSNMQLMALAAGDSRLDQGANILRIGPPGGGKSHIAAALGLALVTTAGACCSSAPQTSSSGYRWRAGT
jgi:hypothetical protein